MASAEGVQKPSLAYGFSQELLYEAEEREGWSYLFSHLCKKYCGNLAFLHRVLKFLDCALIGSCHTGLKPTLLRLKNPRYNSMFDF